MEAKAFIDALEERTEAKIILEDGNTTSPFKIKSVLTRDGYEFDFETGTFSHPAYEKEKVSFIAKVEDSEPDNFFFFDAKEMDIEEMRSIADGHAKKINANGSSVNSDQIRGYKVKFGEDLTKLRRLI